MPRRLRFFPAGSFVEVTCRTMQGRFLLHPTPLVRDLTLGVLGRAAGRYPVQVHAFVFLSNHFHLLLTVPSAQRLAQFMNYLNSNLAREVGRAVRWREKFWGRRYQAILVSGEEAAQIERLRYVLSHGCKEHLVERPTDWPGAHCARALLEGCPVTGSWFNRTLEYQARRRNLLLRSADLVEEESLLLAPIPCWAHLSQSRYRERIAELLRSIELESARWSKQTGAATLGRDAVRKQDPHGLPNRPKRRPAPLVHAVSRAVRREIRECYRAFVAAFRRAAARLRSGALDPEFPLGSFPPGLPFVAEPRAG